MSETRFCTSCSTAVAIDSKFCPKCGAHISLEVPKPKKLLSAKSAKITLLLCILFGTLGVHRFYVGKVMTGLLTIVTGGGFLIWTIIDLTLIIRNKFKDKDGFTLNLSNNLSGKQRFLLIIGSTIVWLATSFSALLFFVNYLTNELIVVAKQQLDALHSNNIAQAYSYNAEEYKKAIPLDKYKIWLAEYPDLQNNNGIVFLNRGLNSYQGFLDTGFVNATIHSQDGNDLQVKYWFIREGGAWKILSIIPQTQAIVNHQTE